MYQYFMKYFVIRILYQTSFLKCIQNILVDSFRPFILVLFVVVVFAGMFGFNDAFAHKAQIVGDYKFDVGWKTEPPIVNESNAIEIVLTIANDFDKQRYDAVFFNSSKDANMDDVTGIADNLEVDIKIGSEKKVFLELTEDSDIPGIYYGSYTPQESGHTKIHIYGKISGSEFEVTFNPEKVEENTKETNTIVIIPDWIRNNAKWWSEGTIGDSDFTSGIQYLIKNQILDVPSTESNTTGGSNEIPAWIKNNAGWWADKLISDDDFVKGIQYMITNGIILV